MEKKQLFGWVNVPADCIRPLQRIHLHAARPAGVNEPTPEGVAGSIEILRLVESLGPDDLCLCLISGGGSALMPAPVEGISLADKLAVTRHLSSAGANIEQLNTVRTQLSRIKGGGLLQACRAGRLASLIISDVLGDPLDMIASGPTVPDSSTPRAALDVLEQFSARAAGISPTVFEVLENAANSPFSRRVHAVILPGEDAGAKLSNNDAGAKQLFNSGVKHFANYVIGNNATAVAAASEEAKRLGYAVVSESATHSEGQAEDVGRDLAERALTMRAGPGATCFISGGEPVVRLVEPSRRGLGGRNQQLVLAAFVRLIDDGAEGIALLSGGTDGEDGPTDAAGAFLDADVLVAARQKNLDPNDFLARNDAYHFFAPLDALLKTGPTQTNVCDVRVVLAGGSTQRHEDTKTEG
jgi:hydroxypyruvate reductase